VDVGSDENKKSTLPGFTAVVYLSVVYLWFCAFIILLICTVSLFL